MWPGSTKEKRWLETLQIALSLNSGKKKCHLAYSLYALHVRIIYGLELYCFTKNLLSFKSGVSRIQKKDIALRRD